MRNIFWVLCFILGMGLILPCKVFAKDDARTTEQLNRELMQECKEFTGEEKIAGLLSAGAEAHNQNGNGYTPLHFLVRYFRTQNVGEPNGDYIEAAKLLIEEGTNVNAVDIDGMTALVMSIIVSNFEMAFYLLDAGANPAIVPPDGTSALHLAAFASHTELCRELIDFGADPKLVDNYGFTPLMKIAEGLRLSDEERSCGTLEMMMEYDPDIFVLHNPDIMPISFSGSYGKIQFTKMLLAHGASVDVPNSIGLYPLHGAARNRKYEIIPLLTTDVAQPDFWVAYYLDDKELFHKLIAEGADVDHLYDIGRTMLHHAAWDGKPDWVILLLEAGASIDTAAENGKTALYISSSAENEDIVKLLLSSGANPNLASDKLRTPLHIAAIGDDDHIVEMLLNAGARPNVVDEEGDTPLHWAAKRHCDASVMQLILGGADLNVRNNKGETPFILACIWPPHPPDLSTTKLLLRWSANPCIPDNDGRLPWYVFRLLKEDDYQYFGENEEEIKRVIAMYNERLQPIIDIAGCCE